jgi:hypothetical protein
MKELPWFESALDGNKSSSSSWSNSPPPPPLDDTGGRAGTSSFFFPFFFVPDSAVKVKKKKKKIFKKFDLVLIYQNTRLQYNWNIAESGIKHHNPHPTPQNKEVPLL